MQNAKTKSSKILLGSIVPEQLRAETAAKKLPSPEYYEETAHPCSNHVMRDQSV